MACLTNVMNKVDREFNEFLKGFLSTEIDEAEKQISNKTVNIFFKLILFSAKSHR